MVVSSRKQGSVEEVVGALRAEGLDVAGTACHVGDKAQLQVRLPRSGPGRPPARGEGSAAQLLGEVWAAPPGGPPPPPPCVLRAARAAAGQLCGIDLW